MAIIKLRQGQLAVAKKSAYGGAFSSLTGANVLSEVFAPNFGYNPEVFERAPVSPYNGNLASLVSPGYATITFQMEARGNGTPGAAFNVEPLLFACGLTRTVNAGSAAIGSVRTPGDNSSSNVPTVAGTFGGTLSGVLVILITAVVTNTSIAFQATFYPGDGSAPESETATQDSADPETLAGTQLSGVTVDFGTPSSSTTGFAVGDVYFVSLTSDQQVDTSYYPAHDPGTFNTTNGPCPVDLQFIEGGVNKHQIQDAMGTVRLIGNRADKLMWEFTLTGKRVIVPTNGTELSSVTYDDTVPIPVVGATATRNAVAIGCWTAFEFNAGAVVEAIPCGSDSTGWKGGRVSRHVPVGSIDPEADAFATENPYTDFYGGTLRAFNFQVGSAAGNKIQVVSDWCQIVGVGRAEQGEVRTQPLSLFFARPAEDAGGNFRSFEIRSL
jgi:hypothetical protein